MKLTKIFATTSALGLFTLASCGAESLGGMSYKEYMDAELQAEVKIDAYIQDRCTWYNGAASFYLQDEEGGYYVYNLKCSKDDYDNNLSVGKFISVTGSKAEWRGEVEINGDVATENQGFTVGSSSKIYKATQVANIAKDTLDQHKNTKVMVTDLTVTKAPYTSFDDFSLSPNSGVDVYFAVKDSNDNELTFVVEAYLESTQFGSPTYTTVTSLALGDKINLEGFVYYWDVPQLQVTKVVKADN